MQGETVKGSGESVAERQAEKAASELFFLLPRRLARGGRLEREREMDW